MVSLKIPTLLQYDLNKVCQFVDEAGKAYNQTQSTIEKEKSYVKNKLLFELNTILFHKAAEGLRKHIEYYLKQVNILLNEELSFIQQNNSSSKKHDYSNLFHAKYMHDIYTHILSKNCLKKPTVKTKCSYNWQCKPDELTEFYQKIKGTYIAKDTSEDDFKAIFEAKPLDDIKKPVRWHDENASELIYFITKLEEKGIIEGNNRADYVKMMACFIKSDGTPFINKQSFPSLKQKMDINLSEAKQKAIDEFVKKFL